MTAISVMGVGVPGAGDVSRVLARSRAMARAYQADAKRMAPPMRLVARIEGHGRVFRDGHLLDEVEYWLKAVEETEPAIFPTGHREFLAPVDPATGGQGLAGFVRASSRANRIGFVGVPLTLILADGRLLDFAVVKVLSTEETLFSTYLVQGYGQPRPPDAAPDGHAADVRIAHLLATDAVTDSPLAAASAR